MNYLIKKYKQYVILFFLIKPKYFPYPTMAIISYFDQLIPDINIHLQIMGKGFHGFWVKSIMFII